ncbi:MAG: hypothetical protein ACSLEG_00770 [Candidatus Carsonella ruddii]
MKFNFNYYIKNIFINIIKYNKIRSNYYKIKKNINKIYKLLKKYFKKKIKLYFLKINYKKGDRSLVGEIGISNFLIINKIIYE